MIPGVDDFREPWGTKRYVPASPHRALVPGRAVIKCVKCQYWISPLIPGWNTTCVVFSLLGGVNHGCFSLSGRLKHGFVFFVL